MKVEWFLKKNWDRKFAHKRYQNEVFKIKALDAVHGYALLEADENRTLFFEKSWLFRFDL